MVFAPFVQCSNHQCLVFTLGVRNLSENCSFVCWNINQFDICRPPGNQVLVVASLSFCSAPVSVDPRSQCFSPRNPKLRTLCLHVSSSVPSLALSVVSSGQCGGCDHLVVVVVCMCRVCGVVCPLSSCSLISLMSYIFMYILMFMYMLDSTTQTTTTQPHSNHTQQHTQHTPHPHTAHSLTLNTTHTTP